MFLLSSLLLLYYKYILSFNFILLLIILNYSCLDGDQVTTELTYNSSGCLVLTKETNDNISFHISNCSEQKSALCLSSKFIFTQFHILNLFILCIVSSN